MSLPALREPQEIDVTWREVDGAARLGPRSPIRAHAPSGTQDTVEISARAAWKWLAGLAVVAFALAGLIAIWAVVTVP